MSLAHLKENDGQMLQGMLKKIKCLSFIPKPLS